MHLVLIETTGNQRYIFATNKLRENIGASQLTYRAGTELVVEALGSVDPERDSSRSGVETIISTSGAALLLVPDERVAHSIIAKVTERALREAPGLAIHGVSLEVDFDLDGKGSATMLNERVRRLYELHQHARSFLPDPQSRFPRLPVVAECSTSGLPAAEYVRVGPPDEHGPRSAVSLAKWRNARDGWKRIAKLVSASVARHVGALHSAGTSPDPETPEDGELQDLSDRMERLNWVAVIHIDGNGVGDIFRHLAERSKARDGRDYLDKLGRFSRALKQCTEKAFDAAVRKLSRLDRRPSIVPLILGGDDVTVLCDGRLAIAFTRELLAAFERETERDDLIKTVAGSAHGGRHRSLSASAGIAFVKPHFPFYLAYGLAEDLLRSAKQVKRMLPDRPASALDFHVLYDASSTSLDEMLSDIRRSRSVDGTKTRLWGGPYIVTDVEKSGPAVWHSLARLEHSVRALHEPDQQDPGQRALPRSMLHELCDGLFLGSEEADARLALVHHRYPTLDRLVEKDEGGRSSLFRKFMDDPAAAEPRRATRFLDALDIAELWS